MPAEKIKRSYRKTKYILYKETLVDFREKFWSFVGSFIGIGTLAYLQSQTLPDSDVLFLIGSFGASSVLIYGIIQSPLAQPRNLIGGHVISAIVGVTIAKFIPDILWLTAALSVSVSIILMQLTKTFASSWRSYRFDSSNWIGTYKKFGILVCNFTGTKRSLNSSSGCPDF